MLKHAGIFGATMFCSQSFGTIQKGSDTSLPLATCNNTVAREKQKNHIRIQFSTLKISFRLVYNKASVRILGLQGRASVPGLLKDAGKDIRAR